jgi:hypothetical protein
MQFTDLNVEVQSVAIPQSMINIFAQSIYAQLEALTMEANSSLELFESQAYTEVITSLQANIQQMQHMLNNVGLLSKLQQQKEA